MAQTDANLTSRMARAAVEAEYARLPESTRSAAALSILDTIGVMVPPSTLDETCQQLEMLTDEECASGSSTLIGKGKTSSATMAAYLNGCCVHVLDYDDTIDDIAHHSSSQTVPAALAVAEKIGAVSGEEFITAVAVGSDFGARLSSAPTGELGRDFQWFPISNFGVFSATVTAAKVLRLSEQQMINALGLALHRCHGVLGAVTAPESELRAIRDGFINKEGVLCALMAQRGVKACSDAIERFFETYYDNEFDADRLTQGLGSEFLGEQASLKPWPSCRVTHGYVEATRLIMAENAIAPGDVKQITCVVSAGTRDQFCEPEATKKNPQLGIQAKFSLYFPIAVGMLKQPEIADFLPENLERPEVLQLAGKIHYRVDESLGYKAVISPATVELETEGGQVFRRQIDEVYGHPDNPMSRTDIISKFRDCLSYAKQPISEQQTEKLISALLALDQVADIRDISALLP
tara:strand:+ start:216 stop:1607 length:1392 start_codon:yes stop_codon:yes gene_type:complete